MLSLIPDLKKSPRRKEEKKGEEEEKKDVVSPKEKKKKDREEKDNKDEGKKKRKREKENGSVTKTAEFELGWDFSAMEKLCTLLRDETQGIMKWKDVTDTFTRKLYQPSLSYPFRGATVGVV